MTTTREEITLVMNEKQDKKSYLCEHNRIKFICFDCYNKRKI